MNAERSQAYGRVMQTLEEVGPTKLQPAEQEQIREAADALLFTEDARDAYDVLSRVEDLADHLVSSERWTTERASALVDDLAAAGPEAIGSRR